LKICYYDESGDDGFPNYSSPLFALSVIYLDHLNWKDIHEQIVEIRRELKRDFDFPIKMELHTKQFLLDKSPYRERPISEPDRIKIINRLCSFIGNLDVRIINVLINKTIIKHQGYDVLNKALTYSVQRIENDIDPKNNPDVKFLIITDEGRVGKMRKTTRAIQRINYIPSQYSSSPIRQEIQALIEDPLPKDSKESYFIQLADLVAYLIYLYGLVHLSIGKFPNRMTSYVSEDILFGWLEMLKPSFKLAAAPANEFGVMIHPK
jgi:hypothetical protein